jgi:transcriptional regulator with XRE-family HTH domain
MGKTPNTPETAQNSFDDIMLTVGLRIKEARVQQQLSQRDLAVKAGVQQSAIYEIETGRPNITLRTLAKMADVLGMNMRDFLPEKTDVTVSPAAFTLLSGLLEKTAAVLAASEEQDAKRQAQYADLLTELKSFAALRFSLERAAVPVQGLRKAKPRAKSTDNGGGQADE